MSDSAPELKCVLPQFFAFYLIFVQSLIMSELQKNSRQNIIDTLELLATKQRQLEFQRRVPFVELSTELFCLWESHYIINQPWFLAAYSADELKAMADFNKALEEVYATFKKLPPIEEFVLTAEWERLSKAAAVALDRFESVVENKSSEAI